MTAADVEKELQSYADKDKTPVLQKYFKTYEGGYAEGDVFIGLSVPLQRSIAKKYKELKLTEVRKLLESKIHEYRFTALEILVFKFKDETQREKIVDFYLKNKKHINN